MNNKKDVEKLQKVIKNQEKLIASYEAANSFYRLIKKNPLLGRGAIRLKNSLRSRKTSGTSISINIKAQNPEIIAVVSPYFRGVNSATKEMIGDVCEVSEIYSRTKASQIAKMILSYSPKKVLLSGYPIGYELLAEELKKANSELRIFVLIHSAFLWFDSFPAENYVFEKFIKLFHEGVIEKVGFCKRDLAEFFKSQGVNSYFVMNRFYPEKHQVKKPDTKNIKIGVWGKNDWHRNITNQVVASLMVQNSKIYVNEVGNHFFLDYERINTCGILPKAEFLKLFSGMDINLYVSMTECFPMTVIESMQYGIPCLVSDTSDVYKFSPLLKEKLTVSTIDGPIGIAGKIREVLEDYESIQKEIANYLPVLKKETENSITKFLA